MIGHSQGANRDLPLNVTGQLVLELQRRGRFRMRYEGKAPRENLDG
jgi:hypothetical protein